MITQDQIDDLVEWAGLKTFGRFILSHCEGDRLPDYRQMDLLNGIPKLVPYVWIYDLRTPQNVRELRMGFAGEKHTELHGRNVCGLADADVISGYEPTSEIVRHFYKSIAEKAVAYNRRNAMILADREMRYRNIESLFFPCSSDGETVNWGIGCLTWETSKQIEENLFLYF